ncbi:hypothetical protein KC361_g4 [Hortaea werneckii]|nr:hypothetical protein KC361_g4 [Hortaea werneckii]
MGPENWEASAVKAADPLRLSCLPKYSTASQSEGSLCPIELIVDDRDRIAIASAVLGCAHPVDCYMRFEPAHPPRATGTPMPKVLVHSSKTSLNEWYALAFQVAGGKTEGLTGLSKPSVTLGDDRVPGTSKSFQERDNAPPVVFVCPLAFAAGNSGNGPLCWHKAKRPACRMHLARSIWRYVEAIPVPECADNIIDAIRCRTSRFSKLPHVAETVCPLLVDLEERKRLEAVSVNAVNGQPRVAGDEWVACCSELPVLLGSALQTSRRAAALVADPDLSHELRVSCLIRGCNC